MMENFILLAKLAGVATAAIPLVIGVRKWGAQDQIVRDMAGQVNKIAACSDDLVSRMERTEYILTGDQSENGLRGDMKRARAEVQEVKDTLFRQNTEIHTTLGILGMRLESVEQRKSTRRKTIGRRTGER